MAFLVVGTAGHIDHGKSALVHALTGIDPDRLKEEKRRGITIELGFADLELDDDRVVSFVDVPGHERFVRQMVAGAAGVDAVMLVVAADQGVQPQTREHLEICSLLGLRRGVVALTKCDLIDSDLAEVVALELRELLGGTFLQDAPLIRVSAKTQEGLLALRSALADLFTGFQERSAEGIARLPVDRSFVLRGFGTVVTGTLVSGRLQEGQEVEILPGGQRGRIRGLQVHRSAVAAVPAGRRTAVNLQGLDCDDVPRGATVTTKDSLLVTRRVWGHLTLLPSAPQNLLKGGSVRFHQGTADAAARLRVLETREDGSLECELYFREEMVLTPGDRFILRRPAPVDTLGGGVVMDVRPPRVKLRTSAAFDPAALDPETGLALRLLRAGVSGREARSLGREMGRAAAENDGFLKALGAQGQAQQVGSRWFARSAWDEARRGSLAMLKRFHADNPTHSGVSREALHAELAGEMPQEAWRALLSGLAAEGEIRLAGDVVALAGYEVILAPEELELARRIDEGFKNAGLDPPGLEAFVRESERAGAGPIVKLLVAEGRLVRIHGGRLFHGEVLAELRAKLRRYAVESPTIDVAAFKELAGVTRKNAIPLLEQLDVERSTRRKGNLREILLDPATDGAGSESS